MMTKDDFKLIADVLLKTEPRLKTPPHSLWSLILIEMDEALKRDYESYDSNKWWSYFNKYMRKEDLR